MLRLRGLKPYLVFAVVCLALAASAAAPAAAAPLPSVRGLAASLDAERTFIEGSAAALVHFTLANDGREDLYVLRWQTPLAGVEANLFDVRRDGQRVAYLGPLVKFGLPAAEDYLRIPAGGSRSVTLDLGRYYDLSRSGEYAVRYRASVQDALRVDGTRVDAVAGLRAVESNTLFLGVERGDRGLAPLPQALRQPLPSPALAPQYVKCAADQQATLVTALGNAESISLAARDYLNNLPVAQRPTDTAYRTWFGAYTSSRYGTVQSHYTSIYSTFNTQTVTFYCNCKKNYYAYVYPDRPYEIHLCRVFWTAPALGIDSKAGTLVHETSHFTVVAGTDDFAYGTAACQQLANSNPDQAIMNADSHEYFAETR